jgi:hypothetical protein
MSDRGNTAYLLIYQCVLVMRFTKHSHTTHIFAWHSDFAFEGTRVEWQSFTRKEQVRQEGKGKPPHMYALPSVFHCHSKHNHSDKKPSPTENLW